MSTPTQWIAPQLSGTAGTLSSTFTGTSCSSATGGYAFTLDNAAVPTPIPHTGAQAVTWTSTYSTYQTMWGITVPAFSVGNNIVGNVIGSTLQTSVVGFGNLYHSGSGTCTSCQRAPSSRPYIGLSTDGGQGAASTYNYDASGDSTGSDWSSFPGGPSSTSGYWSTQGFSTTFYHGNYDSASASTIWNVNATGSETLPASLFLSSKPSWFGTVSWPPIGPDVTGGIDTATAGHTNYIPAEVCYNALSRDAAGLKVFDANSCYSSQQSSPTAPPTNLVLVVH